MSALPFSPELKDGILQLWLDTPGCDVNVFSAEAAAQLTALFDDLDPDRVHAVVFRSAKRGSFLNGAQLMLTSTVQRAQDVAQLTEPVRKAYRAVRTSRVPTIAAIQGSCYGCGVEFALQADYRVADRAADTQFYMTEIADYLLIPAFGATQDLPKLVGLEDACELLLWGARWSADRALEAGLVDAAFDPAELDNGLLAFVGAAAKRARPVRAAQSDDVARVVARERARVEAVPREYRPLYEECFELLAGAGGSADYERELETCARSVVRPMAKAAVAFFFIREVAKARCRRGAPDKRLVHLMVRGLPELRRDIELSRPRDVALLDAEPTDADGLRLIPYAEAGAGSGDVGTALAPVHAPLRWGGDLMIYAPLYFHGVRFFEIAERQPGTRSAEVYDALARLGFSAVSTRPRSGFVLDDLLEAYFAPLRAFVRAGGTKECAAATLSDFGFLRGPGELAQWLGPSFAPELAGARPSGAVAHPPLLDALLISLLDFVLNGRTAATLVHPPAVDVMAREVLDFPLAYTSLCQYLTRNHVARMLERSDSYGAWVEAAALERARHYLGAGKEFYS